MNIKKPTTETPWIKVTPRFRVLDDSREGQITLAASQASETLVCVESALETGSGDGVCLMSSYSDEPDMGITVVDVTFDSVFMPRNSGRIEARSFQPLGSKIELEPCIWHHLHELQAMLATHFSADVAIDVPDLSPALKEFADPDS